MIIQFRDKNQKFITEITLDCNPFNVDDIININNLNESNGYYGYPHIDDENYIVNQINFVLYKKYYPPTFGTDFRENISETFYLLVIVSKVEKLKNK
jgi:hypothetical protein